MDETGWRLRGGQRALWGMFTERHAILQITPSRHDDHAKALLAGSGAIVTSDRWWAYNPPPGQATTDLLVTPQARLRVSRRRPRQRQADR
jgi:hypothetical protein